MRRMLYLCCILCISCFAGEEKMYVWTDENGKKHYSQNPPKDKKFDEKTVTVRSKGKNGGKPSFDFEKARPRESDTCNLAARRYLGQWRQSILQKFRDGTAVCERMHKLEVLNMPIKKCFYKQEQLKEDELKVLTEYKIRRGC